MILKLVIFLTYSATFVFGWCSCAWACSRRTDCPRYHAERLAQWRRDEELKLRSRHPTPPEGGAAA